jgi:adenylate cyclase
MISFFSFKAAKGYDPMTTGEFQRKLTAILSADVQGYSRLMEEDEDSTIRTLTAYRALMSSLIQKHRGKIVDSPGDNLLAEFGSIMDAVRCAVEIQEELRIRNADLPENRRMQFRIGINLGDIIEDGDHIYGDGVNIAARVEGMAEGGGICISGTVYDAIRNKLSMNYEFMGEYVVKNIKEMVRIYRIRVEPEVETAVAKEKKLRLMTWQWAAISVANELMFLLNL